MALRKSRLFRINILFFVVIFFSKKIIFSQNKVAVDSIFTKIFDSNLYPTKIELILKPNKPILIISSLNCSGCVKSFTKYQKDYTFIFILNNESLLDAERLITNYELSNKNIFFTTCNYIKNKSTSICENPTPCCITTKKNDYTFINYDELSILTNGFSLKHKVLKKTLKNL